MNCKFEMTGYCKNCTRADLSAKSESIYADGIVRETNIKIYCKHEDACERIYSDMQKGRCTFDE